MTAGPSLHGPRQGEAGRIAVPGGPLHQRPAGVAQPQHLGDLVEGLSQGVVDGGAQPRVGADALHREKLAVPARHQQKQERKRHVVGQPRGQRVPLQMVDGQERQIVYRGDGLGGHHPHEHAADQPRAAGGGDAVQVREPHAGLVHGLGDQAIEVFEMGAGGDFGDHAAEGPMIVQLRQHAIGKDPPVAGDHRGRRFVATGFDPEHDHGKSP